MGNRLSRARHAVRLTATLLTLVVLPPASAALAQGTGVVTGRVTSVGGEPIQGATGAAHLQFGHENGVHIPKGFAFNFDWKGSGVK